MPRKRSTQSAVSMEARKGYIAQVGELIRGLGFSPVNKRRLQLACAASAGAALLGIVPCVVIAVLVDGYAGDGRLGPHAPLVAGGVVVAALLLRLALRTAAGGLAHAAAYETMYEIRTGLAGHLTRLPLGFFADAATGRLKKLMVDDVEEFEGFIAHHIEDLAAALCMPFLVLGVLIWIDVRMALAAVAVIPLAMLSMSFASKGYMEETRRYHTAQENLNGRIIEFVRSIHEIKAFARSVAELEKFVAAIDEYQQVVERWARRWALPRAGFIVFIENSLLFTLPVGLWLYRRGSVGIGELVLCLLLSMQFSTPIFKVLQQNDALLRMFAGFRRMKEVGDARPLPPASSPGAPQGADIVFDNVSFRYADGEDVLRGVSFTAPQGNVTALVGLSGSGKSTILRLIPRFWDVTGGCIRVGGVDVREMNEAGLMRMVAFMFQENVLFNESLLENIRLGNAGANDAAVRAVAEQACCADFIGALPGGYGSPAGELGGNLSGGERQRVALARTLLKPAPILLLDEATAYADAFTEASMHASLARVLEGRTVIMVAHRLESIAGADRIVVLDKGTVVDAGRHDELLERCPAYTAMWNLAQCNANWNPVGEVATC